MAALMLVWKFVLNNKWVQYALIVLALLMALRWYGNKRWEKGFDQGKQQGISDTLKANEEQWKKRQSDMDTEKKKLDQDRAQLDADRQAIAQNRVTIKTQLDQGVSTINKTIEGLRPKVDLVPVDQLDPVIKKQLAVLKGSK